MKKTTRELTTVAILAAISTLLMFIEFPLPLMPPFLKVDFSTVPALIGGFMFGPIAGIIVALIKDLLHLLSTQTGGVGELADFLCTSVMVVASSVVYSKNKTKKGALLGLLAGIIGIMIAGALANMYILIPFYSKVMPIEAIFETCGKINPFIKDTFSYVLWGAIPFNGIKGIIISIATFLLYKNISRIAKQY